MVDMTENNSSWLQKVGPRLIAVLLWLTTSVLALYEVWLVREMVLRVYARFMADGAPFGADYDTALAMGNWLVFALGVVWIGLVIGGGEYHTKHVGTSKSWRLFARTMAVELAILVLAWFI
jgi:hypothetical protein